MAFSRQARIITLLVIDTAFFFLELIVGYAVGSLALVADAFHMLNDILSLIVALYTIKLATSPSSASNSYGWQRAEILGALINGVFLIALCMSIGLEALGRLISPPEISQPKLIVLVGSMGLLSNIVGLFLFHEHGHGGHSHGHSHDDHTPTGEIALPVGPDEPLNGATEAQPKPVPHRRRSNSITSLPYQHPAETRAQIIESARYGQSFDEAARSPPAHHRMPSTTSRRSKSSRARSQPKAPAPGTNETHPPSRDLVSPGDETAVDDSDGPALPKPAAHDHSSHAHSHDDAERGHDHSDESKNGKGGGAGGHNHGSMNMHGVFLHVLGDALGNVGVISAGLVIWFCEGRWTLYFDPMVSLLITCIIFSSAMPLVKSTSKILLQGVPNHVDLEDVRASLKAVPGVVSVHELHVWQLSETTTVASVHVLILPDSDYMVVANNIREIMHSQGIHSVTIQPEFFNGSLSDSELDDDEDERTCLIRCPPDQCVADTCCPPAPSATTPSRLDHVAEGDERSTRSARSNNGDSHGHSH